MDSSDSRRRSHRVSKMLTQEQLNRYQTFKNNAEKGERMSLARSHFEESGSSLFPDPDGSLALKLFMSIEIERYRTIVEEKDNQLEKALIEKNKLELVIEKNSISIKQLPKLKNSISE